MASMSYSHEDRFQPPAKLLSKTANAGFSYLSPQHQQQLLPARSLSSEAGYNSLPRQKQNNGSVPSSLSQARRKLVNSALQDYLKSLNAMTRSIVLETETVEKENKYNWKKLDVAKKEDLVNDHFMPAGVRMQYDCERTASCCSFSSGMALMGDGCSSANLDRPVYGKELVVENRGQQFSDNWEECSNGKKQLSRSSRDLVYTNEWSANDNQRDELSLSQPSLHEPAEIVEQTNFDRLHKKQLSFRPSHKHSVKPSRQLPQPQTYRGPLGSDGESPRTSDEDYEGLRQPQNPLGFQRSKLRSYSMRSKRGGNGGSIRNSANLRSSVRTSNHIRPGEETPNQGTTDAYCRPSHSHTYSSTSTETDFDEAIDMPDDALLLDHVSRKSSTEETDIDDDYQSQKTPKYNRTRRSFRGTPKITLEQSEVHVNRSLCSEATHSASSFSTTSLSSESFLAPNSSAREEYYRPPSRESLDLDSISMAPSDASKYPMDDEESMTDQSRMTPDSVLSLSSGYSCRRRSKDSEIAVLRNRRGNRGGSYIKVATSDFADRYTQFKNQMSPKHQGDTSYQGSLCTTRATSPASSVSSAVWPAHEQDSSGHLKTPSFSFAKLDSSAATTGTTCCSPDHSSILSSPPCTPLAISCTAASSHLLRKSLFSAHHHEDRESGYVSSSSESFPVASRR